MPTTHTLTVRLSPAQYRSLVKLAAKLNLDKTNVIRLALTRLSEAENLLPKDRE
jgi:predicted transcriptional regulator